MRRRRLVDRRNAHQARNRQAVFFAAACNEAIRIARRDAGLLRFFAGIELNEKRGALAAGSDFLG